MKRSDPQQLGDIIRSILDTEDARPEMDRQKASYIWSEIVGADINRVTTRRYVEGDTMHVYISSAAIKSELAFFTDRLRDKINESIGRIVIKKILLH